MGTPLRVLIVEDSETDLLLILQELQRGGYSPVFERGKTEKGLRGALQNKVWDIILADYRLTQFNSLEALELVKEKRPGHPPDHSWNISIPMIGNW